MKMISPVAESAYSKAVVAEYGTSYLSLDKNRLIKMED
jgi:hypothetical protein